MEVVDERLDKEDNGSNKYNEVPIIKIKQQDKKENRYSKITKNSTAEDSKIPNCDNLSINSTKSIKRLKSLNVVINNINETDLTNKDLTTPDNIEIKSNLFKNQTNNNEVEKDNNIDNNNIDNNNDDIDNKYNNKHLNHKNSKSKLITNNKTESNLTIPFKSNKSNDNSNDIEINNNIINNSNIIDNNNDNSNDQFDKIIEEQEKCVLKNNSIPIIHKKNSNKSDTNNNHSNIFDERPELENLDVVVLKQNTLILPQVKLSKSIRLNKNEEDTDNIKRYDTFLPSGHNKLHLNNNTLVTPIYRSNNTLLINRNRTISNKNKRVSFRSKTKTGEADEVIYVESYKAHNQINAFKKNSTQAKAKKMPACACGNDCIIF